MKKFTIYANCQGAPLANTLLENKEFSSEYQFQRIAPVQTLVEGDLEHVISIVKDVELFIYQPIQEDKRRPAGSDSFSIIKKLKESAQCISFPSLYFDGYFPHLGPMKGYRSRLNLVHDLFIAFLWASKFKQNETLEILQSEKLYPESLSIELLSKSLSQLRARESDFSTDVRVADFIEQNYKFEKLFNQFNHPKKAVFNYIADLILEKVGIQSSCILKKGPSPFEGILTPIYKSTYINLDLDFEEDFNTYHVAGPDISDSQANVIRDFYRFYEGKNRREIKGFVKKVKPFIPRLISKI